MATALPDLAWLDWSFLVVLGLSVVVGLVRGLVFECLALAGWVVAWFSAQWLAPQWAHMLPVGERGSALNLAAAITLSFVGALIVWGLLAKLVRMLVRATPLSAIDRVLGGGFGTLRGVVLLLVVASVVALTPAAQSPAWKDSQGAKALMQALSALKPLLPPAVAAYVPA